MFALLFALDFLIGFFLPWWVLFPLNLLLAFFFNPSASRSYLIYFLAAYSTWLLYSWYLVWKNDTLLANRIGVLFGMPEHLSGNWFWLSLIAGIPAGLVASCAGLAGQYIRKAFSS